MPMRRPSQRSRCATRRWTQQLLKANILRVDRAASARHRARLHDPGPRRRRGRIARDARERCDSSSMHSMRKAGEQICVGEPSPAVRQAQQSGRVYPLRPVLMAITHEDNTIRKQASTGLARRPKPAHRAATRPGNFSRRPSSCSLLAARGRRRRQRVEGCVGIAPAAGGGGARLVPIAHSGGSVLVLLLHTEDGFVWRRRRRLLRRLNELGHERAPSRDQESLASRWRARS